MLTLAAGVQMYPAPIRSTAHGISAASGKVGSILVVVWLNYLGNRNKFWVTWPFALAGAAICWLFVADNTGLDLAEQVSYHSPILALASLRSSPPDCSHHCALQHDVQLNKFCQALPSTLCLHALEQPCTSVKDVKC